MDNLTHSLVGLFLARAGGRHAGPRATAILVLAANAPDADVVCTFGGALSYLHWHRNLTHAIVAAPVMALLTVAVVRLAGRTPVRWIPAFLAALAGVASHLILDLTNNYGVRLFLPFSGQWFHWDTTGVIDLGVWTILLAGVVIPWFAGLVGSEIGERRRAGGGGWAIAALLMLGAYDYGRFVLHSRAVAALDSRIYHGRPARRVAAFPEANPLVWRGVAELSDGWVIVPVDLRSEFRPEDGRFYPRPEAVAAMAAAQQSDTFRLFAEFSQYPAWAAEASDQGTMVRMVDLRFGTPSEPGFEALALVDARNRVTRTEFTFGRPRPR